MGPIDSVCPLFCVISKWIVYTEQGKNHEILMILDGVSYSAFIQLCRVILSRSMNHTVVSLQSDLLLVFNLTLSGLDVCPRLVLTSLGVY